MSNENRGTPGGGFDYSKLPKVNHDEYELPEGRSGWAFQETGRTAILVYIAVLVLCIVITGASQTSPLKDLLANISLGLSIVPAVFGIVGIFRKAGRWWSVVATLATIILNPFLLSAIFIAFAGVVMF